MADRMLNAACSGDVNMLHHLLQENPFLLTDYVMMNSAESPLTIAIKANQLIFVREILKLKPELAKELNQDGVRPLDIASAYGNVEIVQEILVTTGPEVCQLHGREGRTAIHYAVMNGRVEIIDELITACSDCVQGVTTFGETPLHLAVKYCKLEALKRVLLWVEKLGMMEMVNWVDVEGNTVLHYAVSRKQLECVEVLLEWNKKEGNRVLEVNTMNKKGVTAVDIADILRESSNDLHLGEILRRSGAHAASEFNISSNDLHLGEILRRSGGHAASEFNIVFERPEVPDINNHLPSEKPKDLKEIQQLFKFKWQKESTVSDARASLLLVAALIATVTFQAGINPPTYLLDPSNQTNLTVTQNYPNATTNTTTLISNPNTINSNTSTKFLNEIQSSSGDRQFSSMVSITVFLVANSVALSTAISIIDYLTDSLPFQRELRVSMGAMCFAYSWSLASTKPTGTVKDILLGLALWMPYMLRWLPYLVKKLQTKKASVSN